MGIYGYTRAVLGDLYSVVKIGGLRFRCPGYFINHLVISIPPTHFKTKKFIIKPEWCVTLCDCAYSHSTASAVSAVLCCAVLCDCAYPTHAVLLCAMLCHCVIV